ncbi:hypothetical protein OJF2_34540 [Aquisphaera giovannonii]|uniref:Uncharacterized protein n=1 Tax=Aquisphaera giovannonii TaxID=406548 RepID=A0A5B9W3Z8_9BACT|nr:hypothetical protein [Aquisphaera giovannonii]QEH34909.1 hypothetical protein OJF2_34540 [Aquisphaera giovannonii]
MRNIHEIVAEVDALAPDDASELDLARLHALAVEYFSHAEAPRHLDAWFRLFERFPEGDGGGVFWSILHGIEAQPGSDEFVVASVARQPTHLPVLMVNRILNSGRSMVGGCDLVALLRSVTLDERASPEVQQDAERFLARRLTDA